MKIIIHKTENILIAELAEDSSIISSTQDAIDIMGDASYNNCHSIIIREKNLHPDFFRLHTGFAGDMLQKFSTYDVRLAIIGEFSKFRSKNLQDFIKESNRGNRIFFVDDLDAAMSKLTRK